MKKRTLPLAPKVGVPKPMARPMPRPMVPPLVPRVKPRTPISPVRRKI